MLCSRSMVVPDLLGAIRNNSRVSEEEEREGLDINSHGESAYHG